MPRPKSGDFDPKEYMRQYGKDHIRYRKINFNLSKLEDVEIMEWLDNRPEGTSPYLKRLILQDMHNEKSKTHIIR